MKVSENEGATRKGAEYHGKCSGVEDSSYMEFGRKSVLVFAFSYHPDGVWVYSITTSPILSVTVESDKELIIKTFYSEYRLSIDANWTR